MYSSVPDADFQTPLSVTFFFSLPFLFFVFCLLLLFYCLLSIAYFFFFFTLLCVFFEGGLGFLRRPSFCLASGDVRLKDCILNWNQSFLFFLNKWIRTNKRTPRAFVCSRLSWRGRVCALNWIYPRVPHFSPRVEERKNNSSCLQFSFSLSVVFVCLFASLRLLVFRPLRKCILSIWNDVCDVEFQFCRTLLLLRHPRLNVFGNWNFCLARRALALEVEVLHFKLCSLSLQLYLWSLENKTTKFVWLKTLRLLVHNVCPLLAYRIKTDRQRAKELFPNFSNPNLGFLHRFRMWCVEPVLISNAFGQWNLPICGQDTRRALNPSV